MALSAADVGHSRDTRESYNQDCRDFRDLTAAVLNNVVLGGLEPFRNDKGIAIVFGEDPYKHLIEGWFALESGILDKKHINQCFNLYQTLKFNSNADQLSPGCLLVTAHNPTD